MWQASYFGDLGGGATNLVVTPAQHRVAPGDATAIRRLFSSLDLRLFYVDDDDAAAAAGDRAADLRRHRRRSRATRDVQRDGHGHRAAGADNSRASG